MGVASAVLRVLSTTFRRLVEERAPEAAASMGFFAIFSLFPLLLLAVALGSRFLEAEDAQERILETVLRFLPVSRELIRQNVLSVVRIRGAVGGIGIVGLVWSATSAFATLVRNLNRAWPDARPRNLLLDRLIALAVVACLVGLVVLYLVARALVSLPSDWAFAQRAATFANEFVPFQSRALLFLFIVVVVMLLYRWLPRTVVLWREAVAGAAAAAVALWASTSAFTWFLGSGVAKYNVVYGSLGALLAFLSWVYIASLILLGGAHFAFAIARHSRSAGEGSDEEREDEEASDRGRRRQ